VFASSCRQEEGAGRVVLYASADDALVRAVIDRFEKKTGVEVLFVGDTEATKTTGLANRLRAERENPQADVWWSSEVFATIRLAEEGVLEEHLSDATTDWPRELRDGQRRWFGFAPRARVIAYSTERVEPGAAPTTWMALTKERWKGRIVMADPRFGTTRGHLGAMLAYWSHAVGPDYYEAWIEGLAANETRLLTSGNAGVVRAIEAGEADVGMTDTDDVWAARQRGVKIDLVYARHDEPGVAGGGTLLIPNTVARVSGGPNAEHAAMLIEFLLGEEVERLLAESDSHHVPVRRDVAAEFSEYAVPDPLAIDLRAAADAMDEAVAIAMDAIGGGE
jgi:iron(III) transport system substrate-binding protein